MRTLLAGVALIGILLPASAGDTATGMQGGMPVPAGWFESMAAPTAADLRAARKNFELAKLRYEGLKQQQADGGTLTTEHRVALQARLDAINARYK